MINHRKFWYSSYKTEFNKTWGELEKRLWTMVEGCWLSGCWCDALMNSSNINTNTTTVNYYKSMK